MQAIIGSIVVAFSLVWVGGQAHAQASKLDAPVSTQPTMRSEIKRGESAASNCGLHALTDYLAFTTCVSDTVDLNEQKSTKSDPFMLGVAIGAIVQAGIINPAETAGWVAVWHRDASTIIKKYKLSPNDLCSAFEIKCEIVKRVVGAGAK